MNAYLNSADLKSRFLAEISKHEAADQLIKGSYGEMNGQFRGCAIGCSLHSMNIIQGAPDLLGRTGDHRRYPSALGLPIWLAYLEDDIFEQLPIELAKTWPRRFAEAVPVGAVVDDLVRLCNREPFRRLLRTVAGVQYRTAPPNHWYYAADTRYASGLPTGAFVAVATLRDIHEMVPMNGGVGLAGAHESIGDPEYSFGQWEPGRYAWVLDDVRPLSTPVPCRGSLGVWRVPPAVLAQMDGDLTCA